MTTPVLLFDDVTRCFGRCRALDSVTLSVEPGTVLGLVGRNGAGKTTTLRLANGILFPDRGRIRTLGLDPVQEGLAVRTRVSFLSEESALYPWMTVKEILRFASSIHPRWDSSLADSYRERLGLDPSVKIKTLSRGSRAKRSG
jgi:ABC-2 type transport system ATP-binding protein